MGYFSRDELVILKFLRKFKFSINSKFKIVKNYFVKKINLVVQLINPIFSRIL